MIVTLTRTKLFSEKHPSWLVEVTMGDMIRTHTVTESEHKRLTEAQVCSLVICELEMQIDTLKKHMRKPKEELVESGQVIL